MLHRTPPPNLVEPPARPRTRPRSSTASARRNAAYRQRKRAGAIVVRVVVDGWISDLLTEGGFLPAWDAADRAAVERALQAALHVWSRYETP